MSPDATIPRTFSSPNDCSLRGNRNQDNECFSGSDPNILLSPSDGLPAPRYILHSGLNSTDTFPVTADHRLDPWTPQGRQGLAPVSIPHYQPGAKSDANSRASGADEGYYTISHHDAQSIHSMNLRNMNEEQQDMYNQQLIRSVPSNYLDPGPRTQNQDQDQSDQSTQLQPATARHVTASQQIPDAFVCEEDNCDFTGKTHSELKYVQTLSDRSEPILMAYLGNMKLDINEHTYVQYPSVRGLRVLRQSTTLKDIRRLSMDCSQNMARVATTNVSA